MLYPDIIPVPFQLFYIIIPTISIIGNGFIIYVTIRSRRLRSVCNILIALVSLGDMLHTSAQYIMVISHNVIEEHMMQQDFCVYLQVFPLLGLVFASVLLLNVAIDRILSLQKIYRYFSNHKVLYLAGHITLPALLSIGMAVWVLTSKSPNETVVCSIMAPMRGAIYSTFTNSIMILNSLIILCYVIFLFSFRKIRLSKDKMRNIYRSLILISATVVFGWFSTTLIASFVRLFHIDMEQIHSDLLAGLFVNFACATNFFIYFIVRIALVLYAHSSKEYRQVFKTYLLCYASIDDGTGTSRTTEMSAVRAITQFSTKATKIVSHEGR